jgi:hypothetical protein
MPFAALNRERRDRLDFQPAQSLEGCRDPILAADAWVVSAASAIRPAAIFVVVFMFSSGAEVHRHRPEQLPVHWRFRPLVALPPVRDLLLLAKHLFIAAMATIVPGSRMSNEGVFGEEI